KFFEHQFPDMLDVPSTAKSPQQMFGAIAKTYFADKIGVKREDLVVVSIMPCVAKKYEAARDEFKVNGNPDVDFSLTTREIARLIKQFNINFTQLEDETFDSPLGESTGAGLIFGVTGGVIEAACRTAYELQTGETLASVDFTQLRGMDGVRKATINVGGLDLHIGIAHGLGNARALLERVRNGEEVFHAIEIMSCPGGCIGGGGQPYHHGNMEILKGRTKAIYTEDSGKGLRKSHENPDIKKLYDEFLGKPLGHKAHELLHTHYFKRKNI
ncbi:MAG: iron hydrogenase small subunit, partial [Fusobacteria bacterium]|nr:iron hydrogenase small subunit [Fusobacteriota bacterium]